MTGHYTIKQIAKSEIVKILTIRSVLVTMCLTVVAALAATALEAYSDLHQSPRWYTSFDPAQESLTGMIVALLTAGVFGAIAITSEYSSGTIRTTLAANPRRLTLMAGKLGTIAIATTIFCQLLSFSTFALGQAILSIGGAPSADLVDSLRPIVMTGLFIALIALMSFGFGLIFRSAAGALAAFTAMIFVLQLAMRNISAQNLRYTPISMLFNSITATVPGHSGTDPVSPAVGLSLMAVYAALVLALGVVLFVRRDA